MGKVQRIVGSKEEDPSMRVLWSSPLQLESYMISRYRQNMDQIQPRSMQICFMFLRQIAECAGSIRRMCLWSIFVIMHVHVSMGACGSLTLTWICHGYHNKTNADSSCNKNLRTIYRRAYNKASHGDDSAFAIQRIFGPR